MNINWYYLMCIWLDIPNNIRLCTGFYSVNNRAHYPEFINNAATILVKYLSSFRKLFNKSVIFHDF